MAPGPAPVLDEMMGVLPTPPRRPCSEKTSPVRFLGFRSGDPFALSVTKVILAMEIPVWTVTFMAAYAMRTWGWWAAEPETPLLNYPLWQMVFLGPGLETLLMAGLAALMARWISSPFLTSVLSGVVWGGIHYYRSPLSMIGPAWGFFLMTAAFLHWRPRSFWLGWFAAAIPHLFHDVLWHVAAHHWPQ